MAHKRGKAGFTYPQLFFGFLPFFAAYEKLGVGILQLFDFGDDLPLHGRHLILRIMQETAGGPGIPPGDPQEQGDDGYGSKDEGIFHWQTGNAQEA